MIPVSKPIQKDIHAPTLAFFLVFMKHLKIKKTVYLAKNQGAVSILTKNEIILQNQAGDLSYNHAIRRKSPGANGISILASVVGNPSIFQSSSEAQCAQVLLKTDAGVIGSCAE